MEYLVKEGLKPVKKKVDSLVDLKPYYAVHWRRGDYAKARRHDTPSVKHLTEQLKALLPTDDRGYGVRDLYLATDAFEMERDAAGESLAEIGWRLHRFVPKRSHLTSLLDGGVAIVDQLICAQAERFIGTRDSTFSLRVFEERQLMGLPPDSTYNYLCGDDQGFKCQQPAHWPVVDELHRHDDL